MCHCSRSIITFDIRLDNQEPKRHLAHDMETHFWKNIFLMNFTKQNTRFKTQTALQVLVYYYFWLWYTFGILFINLQSVLWLLASNFWLVKV